MTRIALLDYGMGNLHSAAKALEHVGATVDVTNDPKLIAQADKIVFPGVGAMRDCMQGMHEAGIDEVVRHAAFNKPVLAICVGMQALMQRSEENGGVDALGIFEGVVKRFPDVDGLKVPHMGWNQVHQLIRVIQCGTTLSKMHVSTSCIAFMLSRRTLALWRRPVTMV
jgi:glutamine amidotransferase